jgi:hypothetical protein
MSCSERLVKLVKFWQGLENARPARPAGGVVIDRPAKKSISVFVSCWRSLSSYWWIMARNIKVLMGFEAMTEAIEVQKLITVIGKEQYRIGIGDTIENEDV